MSLCMEAHLLRPLGHLKAAFLRANVAAAFVLQVDVASAHQEK